jgi:uncharacterized protein (TIGR00255 family)
MKSMTGFGRASLRRRGLDLEVEVRSVNHRFLTLKQNLPESLSRDEGEMEQMVRQRLGRGSVTLSVSVKSAGEDGPLLPDGKTLKAAVKRLRELQKEAGLKGEIGMEDLLAIPSLWSGASAARNGADLGPELRKLAAKALDELVATREREGVQIERDFRARLDAMQAALEKVAQRAPAVLEAYQKKLDDRIQALLAQKGIEAAKLDVVKEVAIHADRCDVSEELQRLRAHIGEFRKILGQDGPIGRRLDFLTQEMGRETNTIASKGNDAAISALSVEMKAGLEKIKEQVENVE